MPALVILAIAFTSGYMVSSHLQHLNQLLSIFKDNACGQQSAKSDTLCGHAYVIFHHVILHYRSFLVETGYVQVYFDILKTHGVQDTISNGVTQ